MNQTAFSTPPLTETIIEGNEIDSLKNIWLEGCDIAIFHRQIENDIENWLDRLPATKLPAARFSLPADQVKEAVSETFNNKGIINDPQSQWLINDISSLAKYFQELMRTKKINLRLDVVNNNACRKFHQDNVAARLLCSYRGRGTEYGLCQYNAEPELVHELPRHSVAIFKGRRWLPAKPLSLYHRSPQIEGSGETRLLLVIDTGTCDDNCGYC